MNDQNQKPTIEEQYAVALSAGAQTRVVLAAGMQRERAGVQLLRLRAELARTPPRSEELARIAMTDVAVSAALLKAAYAPWLGRGRGRGTLAQAFERLGPVRCTALLSALALREVLPAHGPSLERFWDVAHRRSVAMAWLARRHGEVAPDVAQTFGLFCDVGIPVLLQRLMFHRQEPCELHFLICISASASTLQAL